MSIELEPLFVPTEQEQRELSLAWHRRLRNLSEDVRKASRARPRDDLLLKVIKLQRKTADQLYSASLNNLNETDMKKKAERHWNLRQAFRQG